MGVYTSTDISGKTAKENVCRVDTRKDNTTTLIKGSAYGRH